MGKRKALGHQVKTSTQIVNRNVPWASYSCHSIFICGGDSNIYLMRLLRSGHDKLYTISEVLFLAWHNKHDLKLVPLAFKNLEYDKRYLKLINTEQINL